jgi:hypothetical protein
VTSVAIGGAGGNTVFAGSWDKDIWSWDRETRAVGRRYKGHSDFVKTILCTRIGGKDVSFTVLDKLANVDDNSASYQEAQTPRSSFGIR